MRKNIHKQISAERLQIPATRIPLFEAVEKHLGGRTLVTFFTSFDHPVDIDDDDCDLLQSVLQHIDVSKGLALMVSSPGGDGLAAERIVNTCRAHSGTGDYWAIVPGRAKSAATIIWLGASRIFMAASSELGPVDPQILRREPDGFRQFSAHSLVTGYMCGHRCGVRYMSCMREPRSLFRVCLQLKPLRAAKNLFWFRRPQSVEQEYEETCCAQVGRWSQTPEENRRRAWALCRGSDPAIHASP